MSAIESKIAGFILKWVRGAKAASNDNEANSTQPSAHTARQVQVRQARFSDFKQVCELNLRLGQGPDSVENWRRLWQENPALVGAKDAPIGWVLEVSQEIVGFLGSIRLQYEFRGAMLQAAATCRFAVESDYRAFSHLLVLSFFRQKGVDLFLDTTATPAAARIMTAVRAAAMPQSDYGTVLFWIIDGRHFANAVLAKMGAQGFLSGAVSVLGALALKLDQAGRGRVPRAALSRYRVRKTTICEIGPEFDQLSSEYGQSSPRLRARRNREIMRWHFDPPGNRRAVVVLGCYRGNQLVGYAVMRHDPSNTSELRRSLVADLLVRQDDPDIAEQLITAAYESAQEAGSHVLEIMGFPDCIRRVAQRWKPYARQYPAHPFFFKASDRQLHETLQDKEAWYACPYDGDATLWP